MISEIELFRLRDIAFEYLPATRNKVLASNLRGDDYWCNLYIASVTQCNINLSAIELSALRLLQAVAMYNMPISDDSEITQEDHKEYSICRITNTVKALSEMTGRVIPFSAPDTGAKKELSESERNSLLKLVLGMAIDGYGYNPTATKSTLTGSNKNGLSAKLMTHGISITDDTIRKYLNEAKELI